MAWVAVIGAGGAIAGGLIAKSGSKQSGNQTITNQQQLDPHIQSMLFGENGSSGLLSKYQGYLDQPQSDASKAFAGANSDYLTNYGAGDLGAIHGAAAGLMSGDSAALASIPAYAVGNKVQAPGQNGMDLSGSYDRLINGTPGANPYLDQQIGGAIAQNRLGFQQMQDDSTKNLMQNILSSIRSNSVLTGQYGGSRQGIAEGNAIGTQQTELARAAGQFGQNATNAAVGAKAGAYDADSNRALAATQGLGAQQYGVASQNANTANAAEFMNVGNSYDVSKTNAAATNQMAQANNGAALGGAGLLGGLTSSAYGTATNADNYGINRAGQVNGLLAPYLSANSSSTNTQPMYQNTGGNVLGGALMGAQLGNMFMGGGRTSGGATQGGLLDLFGSGSTFGNYGA